MERKAFVLNLEHPRWVQQLFGDPKWALLWLVVRFYLGVQWLLSGWSKVGDGAWTGEEAGVAVSGFLNGALAKTGGAHPDVQAWYAWFVEHVALPNAKVFSFMVAYGELLVGIALILGIFTGLAAFFGGFMNLNYLLAGTVSSNPTMLLLAILLVVAWRIAGWLGGDRWLLPALLDRD